MVRENWVKKGFVGLNRANPCAQRLSVPALKMLVEKEVLRGVI